MPVTVNTSDLTAIIRNIDVIKAQVLKEVGDLIIKEADKSLKARPTYGGKGKLVASLNKYFTRDTVEVISTLIYSDIQQYGGKIKITEKMRKFFWASYYSTKDVKWMRMALTTKTHITIPKQPYLAITELIKNFALQELRIKFDKYVTAKR